MIVFTLDMDKLKGIEFKQKKHIDPTKPDVVEVLIDGVLFASIYAGDPNTKSIKIISKYITDGSCVRFDDGARSVLPIPSVEITFSNHSKN
jgi:hypothetical protein